MITEMTKYVFWARPSKTTPAHKLFRVDIDADAITWHLESPVTIQIAEIVDVEEEVVAGRIGWIDYVVIRTASGSFEFWPVNPFSPFESQGQTESEAFALVEVVESLRSRNDPAPNPNPYLRASPVHDRFDASKDRDALVSPIDYHKVGRFRVNSWWIVVAVIMILASMAILWAINALTQ